MGGPHSVLGEMGSFSTHYSFVIGDCTYRSLPLTLDSYLILAVSRGAEQPSSLAV
jgi:hypothetical protein